MRVAPHHPAAILAVFVLTYLGLAAGHVPGLRLNRVGIGILGAIAALIFSGGSVRAASEWIDWPTMLVLFGFLVLSAQLQLSGFFGRIAAALAQSLDRPVRFLAALMAAAAGLSAFLNHDIVCYVFAPVVASALLSRRLNPVPFLVALAVASNLGAAATPIGNAQDILIAQVAHLSFRRYIGWSFAPVALSLLASYLLIAGRAIRAGPAPAPGAEAEPGTPAFPLDRAHAAKGVVIFAAVIALCVAGLPKELVVLVAAGIHLASPKFRTEDILSLVDWPLLVLFLCLFVVTGAFQATGYAEDAVRWLRGAGFGLERPGNELVATAGLSALINNAPAVMLLLKIVPLGKPVAGYVMALANSFGGSLILTASVSNLVVAQQARRQGIHLGFGAFARIGIPVTLASLAVLAGWTALVS